MSSAESLRFKWLNYDVEVINLEQREVRDIAFCSYITKSVPLWHNGILICRCNDFLDLKSVAKKFIKERVILMEQVCYARMSEYKRGIMLNEESIIVAAPVIRAYGVYKALAELLAARGRT
ncbi:MAG: hypothetical protein LM598_01385 [Candidatus Verstraetearchaeota archaeon]|jgi:hypothetical protein|nr:hypothetical protein [Candidatus Verstraetearchaeota archaeon]NHW45118.1 hypothetical protein [Candidatus Verstraetearchaeota archaeon]